MSVNAYWIRSQNVGDILTPFLLERLTGRQVVWSEVSPRWLMSGSTVHMAQPGDILCGVGGFEDQYAMPLRLLVLAVRGPRTARQLNCTVDMYGDAGLLLPAVYNPPTAQPVYGWGLVPHYVDYEQAVKEPPAGVRIIPTSLPVTFSGAGRTCASTAASTGPRPTGY